MLLLIPKMIGSVYCQNCKLETHFPYERILSLGTHDIDYDFDFPPNFIFSPLKKEFYHRSIAYVCDLCFYNLKLTQKTYNSLMDNFTEQKSKLLIKLNSRLKEIIELEEDVFIWKYRTELLAGNQHKIENERRTYEELLSSHAISPFFELRSIKQKINQQSFDTIHAGELLFQNFAMSFRKDFYCRSAKFYREITKELTTILNANIKQLHNKLHSEQFQLMNFLEDSNDERQKEADQIRKSLARACKLKENLDNWLISRQQMEQWENPEYYDCKEYEEDDW